MMLVNILELGSTNVRYRLLRMSKIYTNVLYFVHVWRSEPPLIRVSAGGARFLGNSWTLYSVKRIPLLVKTIDETSLRTENKFPAFNCHRHLKAVDNKDKKICSVVFFDIKTMHGETVRSWIFLYWKCAFSQESLLWRYTNKHNWDKKKKTC